MREMMNITYGPGARNTILAPQLKWHRINEDYQLCLIAGLELTAVKECTSKNTYEMLYCGFRLAGVTSMAEAKRMAPDFARRVLCKMIDSIST